MFIQLLSKLLSKKFWESSDFLKLIIQTGSSNIKKRKLGNQHFSGAIHLKASLNHANFYQSNQYLLWINQISLPNVLGQQPF